MELISIQGSRSARIFQITEFNLIALTLRLAHQKFGEVIFDEKELMHLDFNAGQMKELSFLPCERVSKFSNKTS